MRSIARRVPHSAVLVALTLALAVLVTGCSDRTTGAAASASRYHCPMHPTYVSDRPGDCPICNMKLVPIDAPGQDAAAGAGSIVDGRVVIHLSPEKRQLIGLSTTRVERRSLHQTVPAPGVVEHDESRLERIAPRFGGWIRTLHVNTTGQDVQRGQPLLTVYSPELLSTERDYLLANRQLAAANTPESRSAAEAVRNAARQRFQLWEISDAEIRRLEDRGDPAETLVLEAPVSGHVITKTAVAGRAFMAGETLYEIGQLDRLWVRASVAESDLLRVRPGQPARILVPALEDRVIDTRVAFIYPHLNSGSRRGELRLEVDNPDLSLRPDFWVRVEISVDLGECLAVPASAVLDTGTRHLVFVQREDDHLEPREVRIGSRTDDWWEVRQGLDDGDTVVTRALFLVDSESQLKAALTAFTPPADSDAAAAASDAPPSDTAVPSPTDSDPNHTP